ncbi:hypothetical protein SEA_MAGRITTE_23 [Microbacterium phage Magritte]|nr:hypothetical protein SEA_MAGRITTE_23 [Microbacterium phage Magritte]
MAPRKSTKDAPADFDELLAEVPDSDETADEVVAGDEPVQDAPVLTPAQQRLAEQRAKAAERAAAAAEAPIVTEEIPDEDQYAGLSDTEIEELKALEDEDARVNNMKLIAAERSEPSFDNSRKGGTGKTILFHVVKDGFTAFGDVWYRGQEIEIEVGTAAYKRTLDKHGKTWLDIVDDEHAQYARWGERKIAPGEFRPLPGERFEDELVSLDQRRRRTVPVVAV